MLDVQAVEADRDRPQVRLGMVARSSPVVTKFYPVDNRAVSTVDVESFLPLHMTFARREGKRFNDFDYTSGIVRAW